MESHANQDSDDPRIKRVLFLCQANAGRSQMAEGWARQLYPQSIAAFSAGLTPHEVSPRAIQVMAEAGVDISGARSKSIEEFLGQHFDLVVTMCSEADEQCPLFPGQVERLQRNFDNPAKLAATAKDESEALAHYRRIRDEIREFIAALPGVLGLAPALETHLGEMEEPFAVALAQIEHADLPARIWRYDHTVWKENPAEINNRLGWLHAPDEMRGTIAEYERFADQVCAAGFTHALLLGMGGSSLAPEVFRRVFGVGTGRLDLDVLDSTDPDAIREKTGRSDPRRTLYIVSTKSGGTVETLSLFKYCYRLVVSAVGRERAGSFFVAITDPGSGLEELGKQLAFRHVFLADPNVGGRYSALTAFGLVPAALCGVDISRLLERAVSVAVNCAVQPCPVRGDVAAIGLGAFLGGLARTGRDKLTLVIGRPIEPFGAWIEQLIAESTGKEGRGILPVVGEPALAPDRYAADRQFVHIGLAGDESNEARTAAIAAAGQPVARMRLRDIYDLGVQCFVWEMATAIAGSLIGINPFDQPNVETAKVQAREMVAAYQKSGRLPADEPSASEDGIDIYTPFATSGIADAFTKLLARGAKGDGSPRSYVAIQAYLHPGAKIDARLQALRTHLAAREQFAVTVGYGPRFLHSTGQLHKGDAGHGLFVQFTSEHSADLPIPDMPGGETSSLSFGVLELAQALGDRRALVAAGRQVIRLHLGRDPLKNLDTIIRALA